MHLNITTTIEAQGGFEVQNAILILNAFTPTIVKGEEPHINVYCGCSLYKSLADYEAGAAELVNTSQSNNFNYQLEYNLQTCLSFECVYQLIAEQETNVEFIND